VASWLRRALLAAGVVVLLVVIWFALQVVPIGGPGKVVVVVVHQGDSLSTIAGELHTEGVIASPLALRIDFALFGSISVNPGSYGIAQHSSFSHVRSVLQAGPNMVSVYPGMTIHEVALQVAGIEGNSYAASFLRAAKAAAAASPYHPDLSPPALSDQPDAVNALEGLIGPGQYPLVAGESAATLVAEMTVAFDREAAAAGLTTSTRLDGLSAYQILIGASIVEREGYYAFNMPQVARVILNRLARHSSLQMDSTIKYPLAMDSGGVTTQMLQIPSPYNTYLVAGLTPTPIATVSSTALHAMLHAPPGPWLYFVVVDKAGHEAFAATYAEQLAHEARARANGVG
jgi:UPF0755 protein